MPRLLLLALLSLPPVVLQAQADAIVGEWWTENNESRVQLYRTVDNRYAAKIVWINAKDALEVDVTPGDDTENPDLKLRSRPLMGLVFTWGFRHEGDNQWVDGRVYDPENGKTYSAKMTLVDPSTLDLRGFMGISLLGRTTQWKRVRR